jgi:hypothetical protein
MPATVTLSTTTLSTAVGPGDTSILVASTSGLVNGTRLFVDRELMAVAGLGVGTAVNVIRGVDGTSATPHDSSSLIYIGRADQFYSQDPVGAPPEAIPVSPYINVTTGGIWFAQGDTLPPMFGYRWWQPAVTTYTTGALGVRQTTQDPSVTN